MSVTPVMPVSTFWKRAWPSLTTNTPCHSSLSLFSGVAATVAALAVFSPLDAPPPLPPPFFFFGPAGGGRGGGLGAPPPPGAAARRPQKGVGGEKGGPAAP